MATEAQRGLIRIGSNYARLASTLVFGIALVPLLASWLGADALGLFLFLMAQAGMAAIFQDVMRTSLIRELAAAWHGEHDFAETAAAASLVCLATAGLAVLAFAALWLVMPLLNIPGEGLVDAARWMIVFESVFTIINIQLAPAVNLYVVREQFVQQNVWTLLRRADFIVSVLLCSFVIAPEASVSVGLITFAAVAVGWRILMATSAAAVMWVREPRVLPRPWRATRAGVRNIVGTFGWNTTTILAANLHDRAGAFIVNIFFGLWGNAVFGLATRLVSYIRMVTIGMTFGLDAVGARLAAKDDDGSALTDMVTKATRLHAIVAVPAAIGAAVLAEPLLRLWIGRSLEDPDRYIDMAALLVQVMAVGLAARAISDGWVFLLYGAGHIRRYAKLIVVGGLLDPIMAITLTLTLPQLGEGEAVAWNAVTGPAWAVSLTFLVFHGILLPLRGAKILGTRRRVFLQPLVRPLLLAGLLSPLLLLPNLLWADGTAVWRLLDLVAGAAAYGAAYAATGWWLLFTPAERERLTGVLRRLAAR